MRLFAVNIFIFAIGVSGALCAAGPSTNRPSAPGSVVRSNSRVSPNAYHVKEATSYKDFNYQVFLNITDEWNDNLQCSGVIVDESYILTAASCVDRGISIEVIAGTIYTGLADLGQERISVMTEEVYIHRNYSRYGGINDIALIKLEEPWKYDIVSDVKFINPEFLPRRCTVSGWGGGDNKNNVDSSILRYTDATIINCNNIVMPTGYPAPNKRGHLVCATGYRTRGFCQADGGSPLVCGRYLTGIAGYTYNYGKCIDLQYFTSVVPFESWIKSTIYFTSKRSVRSAAFSLPSATLNEVAECNEMNADDETTKENCGQKYFSKLSMKKNK